LHSLAYAEMRLILAKMLFHFKFELDDTSNDWYHQLKAFVVLPASVAELVLTVTESSFVVWERGHLKVRLTPVQG